MLPVTPILGSPGQEEGNSETASKDGAVYRGEEVAADGPHSH